MSYLTDYQARLTASGGIGNSTKYAITSAFADSPFYKIVDINGVEVDCRVIYLVNTNGQNDSAKRQLQVLPGVDVSIGSVATIDGLKWLVVDFVNNDICPIADICKCNLLPFYFKINEITQSVYGYYEKNVVANSDNQVVVLPNDVVLVTIPSTTDTQKIEKNDCFYINSEKYQIDGINLSKDGLIVLRGKEIQSDETPEEFYNLSPTSDTIGSVVVSLNSITLVINETKQLNATVFDPGGDIMPGELVAWSSSDTSVATVNSTGGVIACGVGECTIIATSITSPNVYGSCVVTVSSDSGWF